MPRVTKSQKEQGKPKPEKKRGFQTTPGRAPKDAYLGKAKKIKADLIHRAKVKKAYAKVLKEEGVESNRLIERGRDLKGKGKGKERETAVGKALDDPDLEHGEEADISHQTTSPPHRAQHQSPSRPRPPPQAHTLPPPAQSARQRALSPSIIGRSEPISTEKLRAMKKEAFARFHPARNRFGSTAGGGGGGGGRGRGQPNMGAGIGVLLDQIQRDKAA